MSAGIHGDAVQALASVGWVGTLCEDHHTGVVGVDGFEIILEG